MVAGPRALKMGNHVSHNLKHALHHENHSKSSNKKHEPPHNKKKQQTLGILAFEVANVMSKIIHLHRSLSENEILGLKNDILSSEGVKTLVSGDEKQLLELALEEKLDDLNAAASVVSRLGKKCTLPALQGFEHVYGDIMSGAIDTKELTFLVKDMDSMVRKMERLVNSTANLYSEMEVMNELESATRKFLHNHHEESRKAFEQKLTWQKQDVGHLKDVSLWGQTYDKVVELLARTVCTVYVRIHCVFGDFHSGGDICSASVCKSQVGFSGSFRRAKLDPMPKSGHLNMASNVSKDAGNLKKPVSYSSKNNNNNGHQRRGAVSEFPKNLGVPLRAEHLGPACCSVPGRMFLECLSLNHSISKVDYDDDDDDDGDDDHATCHGESSRISGFLSATSGMTTGLSGLLLHATSRDHPTRDSLVNSSKFGPKGRLMGHAAPSSVGGSALALHYANIIIVLEKFLKYPHLVGDEARDDLYRMLPTSLRRAVKVSLKSYSKEVAIYDGHIAHGWRERLERTLGWLGVLAHNTMRWQSERNLEQQQIVKRTNVLLVQTLYFADREKTEGVICEVLVGLNYICRYEQQQNALADGGSSFDFEECMEWQMQFRGSYDS
ncbi:Protein of unknown function (DUF668 [Striga hermonthica]|uniref:Uncharacterized protein n=1 Tax=Striga hermonthica TaxID=68872 RepID=A0A9N7MVV8_STRHE|nr:Protein of unknown function (DUF668 [Striga hermonthica]